MGEMQPSNNPVGDMGNMGTGGTPEIKNNLVFAILVTLFCCWPFGIPAIVYAAKVDKLVAQGQTQAAMEASKNAKTWSIVSLVCGLVVTLAVLIVYGVLIAAAVAEGGGLEDVLEEIF